MNPLLINGYGISVTVNRARLKVSYKDSSKEDMLFRPHRIPYDQIVIDGHYGNISFEALRWLSKHDVSVILLNWNGNLLSSTFPKEGNNGQLRIKQYEKYLNPEKRVFIAEKMINKKIEKSLVMLKNLSDFYSEIDPEKIKDAFSKELEIFRLKKEMAVNSKKGKIIKNKANTDKNDFKKNITNLMMYEGRIASIYWSELSVVFRKIVPDFDFQSRKNLSYSWNMNASDPINALLNYGYAILEGMVRKYVNTIGLDPSVGFLHEIAPSKHPLVYDLQELFRYVIDYSVVQILESGLKKSDFITTENYHTRLKPETAKKFIEIIRNNFNHRYAFKNKQYTFENIMFENVRGFSRFILSDKKLEFSIPDIEILRNDNQDIRNRILSIKPEERKKLKINKSTLWYQQKKIKEGKTVKLYDKTTVKIK